MSEKTKWFNPGKWTVTPFTWNEKVRADMPKLPDLVHFRNAQREEEENASVGYLIEDKIEIIRRLAEMGVEEFDMGYARNPYQQWSLSEVSVAMKACGIDTRLMMYVHGPTLEVYKKEIDRSVKNGANVIKITGIRSHQIEEPKIIKVLEDSVKYAIKKHSVLVSIGPTRATNLTSVDPIIRFLQVGVDAGADMLQINDSMGIGTPVAMKYIASLVREAFPTNPIIVHSHNDFGLAVANCLGAVQGGADWIDAAVNGLGDRCGSPAFEECVVSLEMLYGVKTEIKMERLTEISRFVEEASGVKLQRHKAVVGEDAWREDSHTPWVMKVRDAGGLDLNWLTASYNPLLVGQHHKLVIGKTAVTPDFISYILDRLGLSYDGARGQQVMDIHWATINEIDNRAKRGEDRFLLEHEFEDLCKSRILMSKALRARAT